MIARIRAAFALLVIASTGLVLAPVQYLILKAGLGNPAVIPQLWHRIVVRALGIRIVVHGEPAAERPLMLASNHVSWTDILVISSVTRVCFIAKSELDGCRSSVRWRACSAPSSWSASAAANPARRPASWPNG